MSGINKILEIKFGSHLYGTNTENSDLDLKGIYLPTAKEIVLGNYKKTLTTTRPKQQFERNTKDDVDIEIFSLDRYLQLLVEGQTVALDILFALWDKGHDFITLEGNDIMHEIYNNRHQILNKNVNAFIGYARQQAAKYGQKGFRVHALRATLDFLKSNEGFVDKLGDTDIIDWVINLKNEYVDIVELQDKKGKFGIYLKICDKHLGLDTRLKYCIQHVQKRFDEYGKRALMAEKNEGLDHKALSHAVRVNSEAVELLTTSFITFPRPDRDLLLKIKLGELPYYEISEIIEKGLEQLNESQKNSTLRESPNTDWVEEFVFKTYSKIVKES